MKKKNLELRPIDISSKKERKLFYSLPFRLAQKFPPWHPGLQFYYDALLNPKRNPFWNESKASFYAVLSDGQIKGRIGFIYPGNLREMPGAAVIIFPDFEEDYSVAEILFEKVTLAAKEVGSTHLVGPFNPNIHYDVGILFEGFERQNTAFMGYHPVYYNAFFLKAGFKSLYDFSAWEIYQENYLKTGKLAFLDERIMSNSDIRIRELNLKQFEQELKLFHYLYSNAFSTVWGFSAPSWEEFKFIAGDLKFLLKSHLAFVAEVKGEPAGFVLSIPDIYSIIEKKYNGRLHPKVLWSLLMKRNKINTVRVMIAGVLPQYRRLGLHIPLFRQLARSGFTAGYRGGEIGWVMDENEPIVKVLLMVGAKRVKGYRLYSKSI